MLSNLIWSDEPYTWKNSFKMVKSADHQGSTSCEVAVLALGQAGHTICIVWQSFVKLV